MKKSIQFFLKIFTVLVLSFFIIVSSIIVNPVLAATPNSYTNNDLIKAVIIRKNIEDDITNNLVTKKTLPFQIEVFLTDDAKNIYDEYFYLLLFKCSFFHNSGKTTFQYNASSNSFILNNFSYDGVSNIIFFAITDGTTGYYREFLISIKEATIEMDNQENQTEGQSGTTSSGASSSKTTSSKTDEPTYILSLEPHIILQSHKIIFHENRLSFDLEMEFLNTSKKLAAENIIINFSPEKYDTSSKNLYLDNSSSTKYIEKIDPQKTAKVKISCGMDKDRNTPVYLLDVETDFEYTDNPEKNPITSSDSATLTIHPANTGKLRIDSIFMPSPTYIYEDFDLEYRLANIGDSELTNVDILITDSDNKRVASMFVGKIPAGESINSPSIKLNIKHVGVFQLNFSVSYLDEKNKSHIIHTTFPMKILNEDEESSGEIEEDGEENPTIVIEKTNSGIDGNLVAGFLVACILFLAAFGIKKFLTWDTDKVIDELNNNFHENNKQNKT